jgi:hypothetical protein
MCHHARVAEFFVGVGRRFCVVVIAKKPDLVGLFGLRRLRGTARRELLDQTPKAWVAH